MKPTVIAAVVGVVMLAGCATQRDLDNLRFQVNTLQSRVATLEGRLNEKEKVLDQSLRQQGDLANKYSEI
ncbi:MAG TPA: hypothetical protein PLW83_06865 [Deltaproteobacteria bacterium]|nr:hypothetical protein [Deltaproteobacteria bacterium]